VVEAYIDHVLGCPLPNIPRFAIVPLSERLFPAFLPSSAMRIVSIVSEHENVTAGPLIIETKHVNMHGTMNKFCANRTLELGCHALLQMLQIPDSWGLADVLESLHFLDWVGALPG